MNKIDLMIGQPSFDVQPNFATTDDDLLLIDQPEFVPSAQQVAPMALKRMPMFNGGVARLGFY